MLLKSKIIGQGTNPIIILHGFLGMSDNWKSYAKKMSSLGFQIHLLDQRNHGNSFHSNDFNYTFLAQDLYNYISHYKINNPSIIGHSMGGKTAMMFSSLYPTVINKLRLRGLSRSKARSMWLKKLLSLIPTNFLFCLLSSAISFIILNRALS